MIASVFREAATPEVIKNGFQKCSLFPFNPDAVEHENASAVSNGSVCLQTQVKTEPRVGVAENFNVQRLLYVESLLKKGRVQEFRSVEGNEWEGEVKN